MCDFSSIKKLPNVREIFEIRNFEVRWQTNSETEFSVIKIKVHDFGESCETTRFTSEALLENGKTIYGGAGNSEVEAIYNLKWWQITSELAGPQ